MVKENVTLMKLVYAPSVYDSDAVVLPHYEHGQVTWVAA